MYRKVEAVEIVDEPLTRMVTASQLDFAYFGDRGCHGETFFAPGIETADYIDNIFHSGAPQQTTRDHAAISTLAMDSDRD